MTDRVWLETKGIEELVKEIKDQPKRLERVTRTAANNAVRPMKARITRGITQNIGVGRNKFSHRVRYKSALKTTTDQRRKSARVWTGLNPLEYRKRIFGKLRERPEGVYTKGKRYFIEDGFIVNFGSEQVVYKRVGLDKYPVERQALDIDTPENEKEIQDATKDSTKKYVEEIERLVKVDWSQVRRKTKRG